MDPINDDEYTAPYVAVKGKYLAKQKWFQSGGDIDKGTGQYALFYNGDENDECVRLAGGNDKFKLTATSSPSIDVLKKVLGRSAYFIKLPATGTVSAKQVIDTTSLFGELKALITSKPALIDKLVLALHEAGLTSVTKDVINSTLASYSTDNTLNGITAGDLKTMANSINEKTALNKIDKACIIEISRLSTTNKVISVVTDMTKVPVVSKFTGTAFNDASTLVMTGGHLEIADAILLSKLAMKEAKSTGFVQFSYLDQTGGKGPGATSIVSALNSASAIVTNTVAPAASKAIAGTSSAIKTGLPAAKHELESIKRATEHPIAEAKHELSKVHAEAKQELSKVHTAVFNVIRGEVSGKATFVSACDSLLRVLSPTTVPPTTAPTTTS